MLTFACFLHYIATAHHSIAGGASSAVTPFSKGSIAGRRMNTVRGTSAAAARGLPKKTERFRLYRAAHDPAVKTNVMVL